MATLWHATYTELGLACFDKDHLIPQFAKTESRRRKPDRRIYTPLADIPGNLESIEIQASVSNLAGHLGGQYLRV